MALTLEPKYGTAGQALTITLASLTNNSARSSAAIDNTATLAIDALLQCKIKTGAGSSATGYILVFAYGSSDNGTSYPDGCGTDTGVTLTNPPNVVLVDTIATPEASTTYISNPRSVAAAFGGVLPAHWGIVVQNQSGATLDATAGNHFVEYQTVNLQSA